MQQFDAKQVWKLFDCDGNGIVDEQEFVCTLIALNPSWTVESARQLLDAYDTDRDGLLQSAEFFKWLFDKQRWFKQGSTSKPGETYYVNADVRQSSWTAPWERGLSFRNCWKQFDHDNNSMVSAGEFVSVLTSLDRGWTAQEAQRLFKEFDTNGDGVLDREEFFNWLFDRGRWSRKESKSRPGYSYYVNADTGQTSWKWPPYASDDPKNRAALLEAVDIDGDGAITPTAFVSAMIALDTNGDGVLQMEELPDAELFKKMDNGFRAASFIGSGAGNPDQLNGPWHEYGRHYNGKACYYNAHGGMIVWESGASGNDWSVQNLGNPGQPKWVVAIGGIRRYYIEQTFTPALDKTTEAPPLGGWIAVHGNASGQFELQTGTWYERKADGSLKTVTTEKDGQHDGSLTIKELERNFMKLDQNRDGVLQRHELRDIA